MPLSPKELKQWKDLIKDGKRIHKDRVEKPTELYRNYYKGKQWLDADAIARYQDRTVDNVVFSNISAIKPSVNLFNPKIFVKPRQKPRRVKGGFFDTFQAAGLVEMLANYDYRELKVKRQVSKTLTDALIGHMGWIQIGYTVETEKFVTKGDDKRMIEEHELIRGDSVFAVRRSPMDLIIDPETKDHLLDDANWIGIKWVKRLKDVKDNPKYKNTTNLKTNFTVPVDDIAGGKPSVSETGSLDEHVADLYDRVLGWDIWDRKNQRLITIVEEHPKVLQDTEWPIKYEGFPLEILYFNENPDDAYSLPDISIYKEAQDELNRMRSLQISHVRKVAGQKYLVKENAMEDEDKRKLTHGPPDVIVEIGGDPNTSFLPVKDAVVSQDLNIVLNSLKQNIREESGVSQFEKGTAGKFDTATEPALIAQGTSIRRRERSDTVEDFITRVVKKMMQVRQQTLNSELEIPISNEQVERARQLGLDQEPANKIEKIAGPEGVQILLPWIKMKKDDIQGEYDFEVEVGSTQPDDQEKRRRDAMALAQMAAQNPLINRVAGTRKWLEAFEFTDVDELMRDPNQVAKEAQDQFIKSVQGEQAKDQPKRDVDLQKTQMKTQASREKTFIDSRTKLAIASGEKDSADKKTLADMIRGNGKDGNSDKKKS